MTIKGKKETNPLSGSMRRLVEASNEAYMNIPVEPAVEGMDEGDEEVSQNLKESMKTMQIFQDNLEKYKKQTKTKKTSIYIDDNVMDILKGLKGLPRFSRYGLKDIACAMIDSFITENKEDFKKFFREKKTLL